MSNIIYQNRLTRDIVEQAYNRFGTISAVSRDLSVPIKTMREYFIKYKIPYKHRAHAKFNENFFENDSEDVFYIAGFIAADGSINNNYLQITLAEKDKDHLVKIRNTMGSEHIISESPTTIKRYNKIYRSNRLSIGSNKMVSDLRRFNIVPNKTKIYTFPEFLINHPFVHHFMRGYCDGDGCWRVYTPNGGHQTACCKVRGTLAFLQTYMEILRKNCDIDIFNKHVGFNGGIGSLEFGGNNICKKISDFLYKDATIYLDRKYNIAKRIKIFGRARNKKREKND